MSVCQSFMAACLFMCVSVSVVCTLMVCWCGDNSVVCVCVCVWCIVGVTGRVHGVWKVHCAMDLGPL